MGRPTILRLNFQPYEDAEDPFDLDMNIWNFYQFSHRRKRYEDRDKFIQTVDRNYDITPRRWLAPLLKKNRAFFVSKYEHGDVRYSKFHATGGCPWDTTRVAGVMFTKEKRFKEHAETWDEARLESDADIMLEMYSNYCNGNVMDAYFSAIFPEDEDDMDLNCGSGELYPGKDAVNWDGLAEFVSDQLNHRPKPWFIVCSDESARQDIERLGAHVIAVESEQALGIERVPQLPPASILAALEKKRCAQLTRSQASG